MNPKLLSFGIVSAFVIAVLLAGSASALSCAPSAKIGTVAYNDSTPILEDVRGIPPSPTFKAVVDHYRADPSTLPEPIAWNAHDIALSRTTLLNVDVKEGDVVIVSGLGEMCSPAYIGLYRDGELRAAELLGGYTNRTVDNTTLSFTPVSREDCGEVYCDTPVRVEIGEEVRTLSVNDSVFFRGIGGVMVLRSDIVPAEARSYTDYDGSDFRQPRGSGWESDRLHVLVMPHEAPVEPHVRPELLGITYTQSADGTCRRHYGDDLTNNEVVDSSYCTQPADCIQVIAHAKDPVTGNIQQFPTPCDVPAGWEEVDGPIPDPIDFDVRPPLWHRFVTWLAGLF